MISVRLSAKQLQALESEARRIGSRPAQLAATVIRWHLERVRAARRASLHGWPPIGREGAAKT